MNSYNTFAAVSRMHGAKMQQSPACHLKHQSKLLMAACREQTQILLQAVRSPTRSRPSTGLHQMPMSADLTSNLKAVPPWPQERRVSKVSCLATLVLRSVSCDNPAADNTLMLHFHLLCCSIGPRLGPVTAVLADYCSRHKGSDAKCC